MSSLSILELPSTLLTDDELLQLNCPTIELSGCGQLTPRCFNSLLLVGSFLMRSTQLQFSSGSREKELSSWSKSVRLKHLIPAKRLSKSWTDSPFPLFSAGNDCTRIFSISPWLEQESCLSVLRVWPTRLRIEKTDSALFSFSLMKIALKLERILFSFFRCLAASFKECSKRFFFI